MDITAYLRKISKFNLLTKEQEQELFREVKRGNIEARELAIVSNLRLVVNIAKRYLHTKVPLQDLIQEGNMGLIKSVDKFEPDFDKRFSTYSTFWIKQSILRFLNDSKNFVRYPSYIVDYINKITKFALSYRDKHHKLPPNKEIAKEMGLSLVETKKILDLMNISYVSLEEQIDNGLSVGCKEKAVDENMCEEIKNNSIVDMVKKLRGTEQEILVHRYGLFGEKEMTLEELADKLDITRERVRQIQKSVVEKLRERAKRS